MEKLNIAKILKDCPKGTKLYSPLCGECYFEELNQETIICKKRNTQTITFTSGGYYMLPVFDGAEPMIFPSKEQRDWSKFQRPFNDGDILFVKSANSWILIYKDSENKEDIYKYAAISKHPNNKFIFYDNNPLCCKEDVSTIRLATEEEKGKLFKAIKENGYKWNAESKTLEKLVNPQFKVGDIIQDVDTFKVKIIEINIDDECYIYESKILKRIGSIPLNEQSNWELVPNKFDISTLNPFKSRVLVRDNNTEKWKPSFWGFYDIDSAMNYPYECCGNSFAQCIPYKGNEHLLGTTNNCDEFYKNWCE